MIHVLQVIIGLLRRAFSCVLEVLMKRVTKP